MKKSCKRIKGFDRKKRTYGRLFILSWEIGFLIFFAVPLLQSLSYAFSTVRFDGTQTLVEFCGLKNFRYAFYESASYVDNLTESIGTFIYSIPLLLSLSLIVALMLNGKFKGRIFMRAIFFIPVIISTGVVIEFIRQDSTAQSLISASQNESNPYLRGLIDFTAVMDGLNLPKSTQKLALSLIKQIYELLWNSGVPIVLFISGLQSIPDQLYEVSRVEGATKWEEFWYITFPMLHGTTLLTLIYISIELFTSNANPVIKQAYTAIRQQIFDTSSAMLWAYFAIVGGILGIAVLLIQRIFIKKTE